MKRHFQVLFAGKIPLDKQPPGNSFLIWKIPRTCVSWVVSIKFFHCTKKKFRQLPPYIPVQFTSYYDEDETLWINRWKAVCNQTTDGLAIHGESTYGIDALRFLLVPKQVVNMASAIVKITIVWIENENQEIEDVIHHSEST